MSYRRTKEELDAEFEKFLKESVSDDSVELSSPDKQLKTNSQKSSQKPTVSWWQDHEHSSGAHSSKQRFIKAKKPLTETKKAVSGESHHKPVPKPRSKAPDTHIQSDMITNAKALDISQSLERDGASSESQSSRTNENLQKVADRSPDEAKDTDDVSQEHINESVLTSAGNMTSMGLDTLEEEEEKAMFFAQIEAEASSAIDYSKLNRELDLTHSTVATDLREEDVTAVEQSKTGAVEAVGESPAHASFPHYSDDFEDEDSIKEPLEENSKTSPILARVSLYDSLDDTGGEHRAKDTAGSLDRGLLYAQSGGSEVEALQEAYRQIHSVEDSDGHHYFSLEDRWRTNRPVSPPSPPQQSLQPASTIESDLPTAEELMRPIRPENNHIRGFSLQPVSDAELHDEHKSQSLKRTFSVVTPSELELKQPGNTGTAVGLKGVIRSTSHKSPEPPHLYMTSSIRKDVERLLQEQNKHSSQTLSLASNVKKQLTSRGSSVFHSSRSSERKPTLAPSRGKAENGKAAGNLRSLRTSKAAATPRAPPSKTKSTKKQEQDDGGAAAGSGLRVSSELVASVQSLVAVLQQQIDTSSHNDAVQEVRCSQDSKYTQPPPQVKTIREGSVMEALRVQLAQKEKELQMMKDEVEEVNSLRQQNYLLQSKLRSAEETSQKRRLVEAAGPDTHETFQQIDKEMKEQEMLIKGYQQENEKLCLQMKAQQAKSKANEEAMFNENQSLLNELVFTREQLRKKRLVGNMCSMDHTKRISDLLAQISILQRNEAELSEENHRRKQETQSLEVELQLMKKERDVGKAQVISTSGDKTFELLVLEDQHREEVAALKKKLQWFAENQELLDRDAGRLKAATAEIFQLKEQSLALHILQT
ncbi:hypothetical protein ILYODFUR_009878, partial [Ilyodon furcidens]